ncbi:hypothetical protein TNCV_841371 [Trichonephila clavipes]|nr:hypothetical protein TNCV_841371 [Trichonephila clavipes]
MDPPKSEQRGMVRFLAAEGVFQQEIFAVRLPSWIPKLLNDRQKTERLGAALTQPIQYHNVGDDFVPAIVTEDESWCCHYEPETRGQSLQWEYLKLQPPKKGKTVISAGQIRVGRRRKGVSYRLFKSEAYEVLLDQNHAARL